MKTKRQKSKSGSVLILTLALLTISCLVIGALAALTSTNSNNLRITIARERAFYLADAGLRLAINQMEDDQSGFITKGSSRGFFSDTDMLDVVDLDEDEEQTWGFSTTIANIAGRTNQLVAVGTYDGITTTASVTCVDVSTNYYLNFIYRTVVFSGAQGGNFYVGGNGSSADFVNGDVYVRGNIQVSGDARLRYGEMDSNDNGVQEPGETWDEAYAVQTYGPMTQDEFDAHAASLSAYSHLFYGNGLYDPGEAFVDSIGNGVYDENEEFTDLNGDGVYTPGDTIVDNGNGVWDDGEPWVDDNDRYGRDNGRYDPAGGFYDAYGRWRTSYTTGWLWWRRTHSCADWPAEAFEDQSDVTHTVAEPFVDRNGTYDMGEQFYDDRNGVYDWGTMASGVITGMEYVDESLGLRNTVGGNDVVQTPDLASMYYNWPKTGTTPTSPSDGWGHDVMVTASDYSANGLAVLDDDDPEHIFIRNPSRNSNRSVGGVTIRSRGYTPIYYENDEGDSVRVDDYFLEDPTDSTYNSPDSNYEIGSAGSKTYPMLVNVKESQNEKVYYIDGNLYLHSPVAYSLRFREPGTKITLVVNGNITISDEFYYNADYDEDLRYSDIDSTIVNNAEDVLCLIALENPNIPDNSGNILIGDASYGTGGSIHAMMYAENDFIDNNISGSGQSFISIYGNMTAGGELDIKRSAGDWTRLDVTLDRRLSQGAIVAKGLPPAPAGSHFIGTDGRPEWEIIPGTWSSSSVLNQ